MNSKINKLPYKIKYIQFRNEQNIFNKPLIDTSNPIVAGILGKKYEPGFGLSEKWSVKLVDFIDAELTEQQITDSFWNITQFKKLCQ